MVLEPRTLLGIPSPFSIPHRREVQRPAAVGVVGAGLACLLACSLTVIILVLLVIPCLSGGGSTTLNASMATRLLCVVQSLTHPKSEAWAE